MTRFLAFRKFSDEQKVFQQNFGQLEMHFGLSHLIVELN